MSLENLLLTPATLSHPLFITANLIWLNQKITISDLTEFLTNYVFPMLIVKKYKK